MREMRDSGVPWIGDMPKEWMVCRIKHVLMPGKDGIKIGPFGSSLTNKVNGEGVYKIYGQWNIVNKDFSAGKNYVSEETFEELRNYMVYTGDVLISMMGTIGKCAIIPCDIQPGIMDSHVIKARLDKSLFIDRYFERVFDKDNSSIVYEQMQKGKKGSIMDGLNSSIVKNLIIPFPSIDEQQRIADFLDAKCAELDTILDNTRASIEDYKALKLSVITEAVTKGIRGERPMKDSGVEWIGEIPEEWRMSRVGLHFSIILGKMLCSEPLDESYSLEKYFCAADVHFSGVSFDGLKTMWFSPTEKTLYKVFNGDLLVVEGGAGAGGAAIASGVTEDIFIQNSIMIVRPMAHNSGTYLKYLLESLVGRGYVDFACNKATIPHFTKDKLGQVPFSLPSTVEQQEIAAYLDEKCAAIDSLIASKEALITELEAYKKSLIYEYVTGKKEVL